MKKNILITLALILLVSCGNRVRSTLPWEYKIMKEKEYGGFPTLLTSYNIKGKICEEKLKNYPIKAPIDCSIQKWTLFNDPDNEEKKDVTEDIQGCIKSI